MFRSDSPEDYPTNEMLWLLSPKHTRHRSFTWPAHTLACTCPIDVFFPDDRDALVLVVAFFTADPALSPVDAVLAEEPPGNASPERLMISSRSRASSSSSSRCLAPFEKKKYDEEKRV